MMNADLRKENIEILKNDYIKFIKDTIQETGSLYPSFTVFCEIKGEYEDDKPKIGLIHIPVPNRFMENADSKDELVNEVLPEISKTIKKDFIPYALAWASEVWIKRIDKEKVKSIDDLSKLADIAVRTEAVFITIETDDGTKMYTYEIVREGKQITSDGDLVDKIELVADENMPEDADPGTFDGRFTNLFKVFKD